MHQLDLSPKMNPLPTIFLFLILTTASQAQDPGLLPTSTTGHIINHTYYTLSYSEEHEQAEWVAYELTKQDVAGVAKRINSYRPDPKIKTGSSESFDFKGSGYDRGHLAPAGDMKRNETAMSESFFYSNISPQLDVFNQGIWHQLEIKVREWASEKGFLYVVTGPVLRSKIDQIGINKVSVPGYFYKVLLSFKEDKVESVAFLLPNENGTMPLHDYAITIDELEQITGINFWKVLPDSIETDLENSIRLTNWFSSRELNTRIIQNTTPLSSNQLPEDAINSIDANLYIGKGMTVCGCVVSANYVEYASATYLNLDNKFPDHHFTIAIWGNQRINFKEKPEEFFLGKTVCTKGLIKNLKGIPSINAQYQSDIWILE